MNTSSTSPSSFIDQVKDLANAEENVSNNVQQCQQNNWSKEVKSFINDLYSYQLTHRKRARDALTLLNQSSWEGDQRIIQKQITPNTSYIAKSTAFNKSEQGLINSFQQLLNNLLAHYHKICKNGNETGYIVVADILDKNRRDKDLLQSRISNIKEFMMKVQNTNKSTSQYHASST